jgi:tetratricopeptide (TPR) repeat protein
LRRGSALFPAIAAACALLAACAAGRGGVSAAQQAKFQAGNDAYERGAYDEAAADYEEIASAGVASAALQYNLGNALFKAGRVGPAILAYERAMRLDPKDPDTRGNLDYLRTLLADRITPSVSPLTALGLGYVMDLTSADEDAWIFIVAWIAGGLCVAITLLADDGRVKKAALYAGAVLALPALLAGANLAAKAYLESTRVEGVVMAHEVNVLSGAGEENPTLFTVHEGLKVRVYTRTGEWVQVALESGLAGWLPASALEVI